MNHGICQTLMKYVCRKGAVQELAETGNGFPLFLDSHKEILPRDQMTGEKMKNTGFLLQIHFTKQLSGTMIKYLKMPAIYKPCLAY